ncbi:ribonuclease domain-containing protein [Streptomyces sp. NPDC006356]
MSSSLAEATAPDAERRKKPRLRGRRALTVAGVLLALVGGTAGTAIAQPPPAPCIQWCNNPPGGSPSISNEEWNDAQEAATFWANHRVDPHYNWGIGQLDYAAGHGWPGQAEGGRWYDFWDSAAHATRFIYYGGRYNDRGGDLASFEQQARRVPPSRAFSTGNGRTAPYVEYDIDEHARTRGQDRGLRRIIRNPLTGNVFATWDHYQTFAWLGKF